MEGAEVRRAAKSDSSQPGIVEAIRATRWKCWIMREPCDLLCWHQDYDIFATLECKPESAKRKDGTVRLRADQPEQNEFLELTGTPVVATAVDALLALARTLDKHFGRTP